MPIFDSLKKGSQICMITFLPILKHESKAINADGTRLFGIVQNNTGFSASFLLIMVILNEIVFSLHK